MQQFFDIKERYGDHILFFRVGDFYEMFYDDALTASKVLDLTLTGKSCGQEERAPMCGVPFHSCDTYIAKLVSKGYKVAICEQMEDPATTKGLVKRDVVRVITPGTVSDKAMLKEDRNNFLACVATSDEGTSVAFADISTGEIHLTSFTTDVENCILNEFSKFMPAEILVMPAVLDKYPAIREFVKEKLGSLVTLMDDLLTDGMDEIIAGHFKVDKPEQLGIENVFHQKYCLYYLLIYIHNTQKCDLKYLTRLEVYSPKKYMALDITARRNLELVETMHSREKNGSLLYVLDKTKSAMGARTLRSCVERPLLSPVDIERRLSAVEELNRDEITRVRVQKDLSDVYDLERLLTKVMYRSANPKDLLALKQTFALIPDIKAAVSGFSSALLKKLYAGIDEMGDLHDLISRAVDDEASTVMRDGGYIKAGYNADVDEYRKLIHDSAAVIHEVENRERERTGIKTLKVGYNRVFGYYIEITRQYFDMIPEDYIRKQTLTDKERFITQELKELEYKIISAKDKVLVLEQHLFSEVLETLADSYRRIQTTAASLAALDVLCSFSQVSLEQNYVKPEITEDDVLEIVDGRHPVVETRLKDSLFVPNDLYLNQNDQRIMIITGPNMGGKSTYMRQTALIVIMAQIGCFVPARRARIGLVDKIFTRVGAADDLSLGQSTFMLEMSEVAYILKNATPRSLLIFDEIGRGTSTFDGMSIARAVVEYIAKTRAVRAKTLFATHYHELCTLEGELDGVLNCSVTVKKRGEQVVFLRKIVQGGADESFGIEVAALAGIPKEVVFRARKILQTITPEGILPPKSPTEQTQQISFEDVSGREITEELKKLDVSTLTPIEAISKLYELSNKAKNNG